MSAEKIKDVLSVAPQIAAFVSDRVELAPADQGIEKPYISYEFDSDDPVRDLDGVDTSLTRQDWNIFVVSNDFDEANTIKNLIIEEFCNITDTFSAYFSESDYNFNGELETHNFELSFRIVYTN